MQENTNKAIFLNSIILYAKLIITAIAGLLTTRFALQALGVDDFGLFSVVGGVISFYCYCKHNNDKHLQSLYSDSNWKRGYETD